MNLFSFADEIYRIHDVDDDVVVDHAFECVGSSASQSAIDQIIDIINPQGTINLFGVSEYPVPINTRMVLEKGLTIQNMMKYSSKETQETLQVLLQVG